jgi:hypothetical protein
MYSSVTAGITHLPSKAPCTTASELTWLGLHHKVSQALGFGNIKVLVDKVEASGWQQGIKLCHYTSVSTLVSAVVCQLRLAATLVPLQWPMGLP